jgi:hypothetical protein
LSAADWAPAWLWLAVIASGLYHGLNPAMGWPLAVSAGLMERNPRAVVAALGPLGAGHLLAMLLVLLPFALLAALVEWQREIQIGASLLVIGFGIFRLVEQRHPRALARIRPTQLALWSFAIAIAHGAGLMLVPIYLGICRQADLDDAHRAATSLIRSDLGMAVLVAIVHAIAMIAAGGCLAWLVYRHLGLKFVSRSWFNLDTAWAASLILVGAVALAFDLTTSHDTTSHADWRGATISQSRMRAIVPETICIATPSVHPSMIIEVQNRCGVSRSTITPTDAKATSAARKVPTALRSSAASIPRDVRSGARSSCA